MAHFRTLLPEALNVANHVVVLPLVPPCMEAACHNGHYCDAHFLPFFACRTVGDVLADCMGRDPDMRTTVGCGHTCGGGIAQMSPNLTVMTGHAEYSKPHHPARV